MVLWAAFSTSALAGTIIYLALGAVHLAALGIAAASCYVVAGLFRDAESASMAWRRAFFSCPHSACHLPFDLPVYYCPRCHAKHERLIPGSYGVLQRRCQCDNKLPAFFLLRRDHLEGFCPHCDRLLHKSVGAVRRMDIPLLGGAAAGKSTFLLAATIELEKRAADGLISLEFTSDKHERSFQEGREILLNNSRLRKTSDLSPDAFQAQLTAPDGRSLLLSWYDPAGEIDQGDDAGRHQQNYLRYSSAAVFLIDPFSIPQVREEYETELRALPVEAISFCEERPEDVYARSRWSVQSHDRKRRTALPLAVVLTKVDVLGIGEKILPSAEFPPGAADERTAIGSDDASQRIRCWLEQRGERAT